jgi:hypothetical protein
VFAVKRLDQTADRMGELGRHSKATEEEMIRILNKDLK